MYTMYDMYLAGSVLLFSAIVTVNSEIFENIVKRRFCNVNNSRLGHDQHTLVNDRMNSPFPRILFSRNFENKILAKISEFTVITTCSPLTALKGHKARHD